LTSAKTLFGSTRIYVFYWLRLQQVRRLAYKQSRSKGVFPIMRQREPQWRRKGTIGYTFATDDGWVFRPAPKRPADRSFNAADSRPRAWRSFWRTGSPFKKAFDLSVSTDRVTVCRMTAQDATGATGPKMWPKWPIASALSAFRFWGHPGGGL